MWFFVFFCGSTKCSICSCGTRIHQTQSRYIKILRIILLRFTRSLNKASIFGEICSHPSVQTPLILQIKPDRSGQTTRNQSLQLTSCWPESYREEICQTRRRRTALKFNSPALTGVATESFLKCVKTSSRNGGVLKEGSKRTKE